MATLLMFSGGIDSTAALLHLLSKTEERVHAHHIVLKECKPFSKDKYFKRKSIPTKGHDGKWKAELNSVYKIIPYMKRNYRKFRFTVSGMDFSNVQTKFMSNFPSRGFMANFILHQYQEIDTLIHTTTFSSVDNINHDRFIIHSTWGNNYDRYGNTERFKYLADVSMKNMNRKIKITPYFSSYDGREESDMDLCKSDYVRENFSLELFDMTWACDFPKNGLECGECNSCKEKLLTAELAYGKEKRNEIEMKMEKFL